jgi:hypothetical protein
LHDRRERLYRSTLGVREGALQSGGHLYELSISDISIN